LPPELGRNVYERPLGCAARSTIIGVAVPALIPILVLVSTQVPIKEVLKAEEDRRRPPLREKGARTAFELPARRSLPAETWLVAASD